jgi:hypothetical protein
MPVLSQACYPTALHQSATPSSPDRIEAGLNLHLRVAVPKSPDRESSRTSAQVEDCSRLRTPSGRRLTTRSKSKRRWNDTGRMGGCQPFYSRRVKRIIYDTAEVMHSHRWRTVKCSDRSGRKMWKMQNYCVHFGRIGFSTQDYRLAILIARVPTGDYWLAIVNTRFKMQ